MGAWGCDTFENDDASDWIRDLEGADDLSIIEQTLNVVTGNKEGYLEVPECACALAAAEVVAALKNCPAPSLPPDVVQWSKNKAKPSELLVRRAIQVIDIILKSSELRQLWLDSGEFVKWRAAVTDIKSRLLMQQ